MYSEHLHPNLKLFVDYTFLCSTVNDAALSNSHLNNNLSKINNWPYKWKLSFNPDGSKLSQEVVFSRKNIIFTTFWLHLIFLLSVLSLKTFKINNTLYVFAFDNLQGLHKTSFRLLWKLTFCDKKTAKSVEVYSTQYNNLSNT